MELKDRIKALHEYSGKNLSEFSRFVGFKTPQAVRELIAGNTKKLSQSATSLLEKAFPNLNIDWLLTGEGEMLKDDVSTEIHIQMGERVPLIPASAFAGGVKGFAAEAHMLERCEKVNSPVAGAEMAIPITGDSMEPDYPDGSLAYIRKINEAAFIPWGHTVILDTENGAFIKKIYPDNDNEVYVWAKSINPNYPPMHIPKTSIHNIFRVLGIARIFTTM